MNMKKEKKLIKKTIKLNIKQNHILNNSVTLDYIIKIYKKNIYYLKKY